MKGSEILRFDGTYSVLLLSISLACFLLCAILLYVVHSRRYKLNWFERNRLDSFACEEATIVKLCNRQRYHSGSTCSDGSLADLTSALPQIRSEVWQDQQQGEAACSAKAVDRNSLKSIISSASTATTLASEPSAVAVSDDYELAKASGSAVDLDAVAQNYQPTTGQKSKVSTMYEKLDHTQFNADMYQVKAEGSAGSDETPGTAKLHLSCSYNSQFSVLCIRVFHVEGSISHSHVVNPYLRVSLMSDSKSEQVKVSHVQRNTTELQFEEDFVFDDVNQGDLETDTVNVFVLNEVPKSDSDSGAVAEHCLGGVQFSLDQLLNSAREGNVKPVSMILPLCSAETITNKMSKYGDVQLSMSYLQSAERLTISILRVKGLSVPTSVKANGNPDVFVKLTVTTSSGKNRINKKKKRTGTQKNTTSPVFNEAFTFHVTRIGLQTASIQLSVDHELPPPYIPLQQREVPLAKLSFASGHLCDFVHSASNGLQAKWFRLEAPEPR
ncbi:synaptotagmin-8 [Galendromus occidentalis]|uniref:Synaptotagmin-8 n=1 Tax=Galendromus occidentalis TaxID=34638 RepID=A0AAJ6QY04_9ACAR|nr:synaptotagmin-8 [Galendromus occidentalis]